MLMISKLAQCFLLAKNFNLFSFIALAIIPEKAHHEEEDNLSSCIYSFIYTHRFSVSRFLFYFRDLFIVIPHIFFLLLFLLICRPCLFCFLYHLCFGYFFSSYFLCPLLLSKPLPCQSSPFSRLFGWKRDTSSCFLLQTELQ